MALCVRTTGEEKKRGNDGQQTLGQGWNRSPWPQPFCTLGTHTAKWAIGHPNCVFVLCCFKKCFYCAECTIKAWTRQVLLSLSFICLVTKQSLWLQVMLPDLNFSVTLYSVKWFELVNKILREQRYIFTCFKLIHSLKQITEDKSFINWVTVLSALKSFVVKGQELKRLYFKAFKARQRREEPPV